MPFAGYSDFDACIADNQDVDDPEAYCAEIKRQVEGDASLSDSQAAALEHGDCPEGHVSINGECVAVEDAEIVPPLDLSDGAAFQLGSLDTQPIEREELDGDRVAYRRVRLLDTGVWTDKESRTPTLYGETGMENLDLEWDESKYEGPPVNIMHDADQTTGEPNDTSVGGYIEPGSVTVDDGSVYADLVLDRGESAGAYADDNLRTALESGGTAGFGGPSVELDIDPARDLKPSDHPVAREELVGGALSGVALVMDPASKASSFARQTSERAVALSASGGETPMVYHLKHGGMSDTLPAAQLLESLDVDENDLDLADDVELANVPVQELVALIAESYGADPAELMDALDPFLDGDAEMQEDEEDEEEAEDGEEDEEDDDEGDDVDIDMDEEVAALEERIAALEEMVDSLMAADDVEEELEEAKEELAAAEEVKELASTVEELESTAEDLQERARKLEEQPKNPKALAGEGNGDSESVVEGRVSEIQTSSRY